MLKGLTRKGINLFLQMPIQVRASMVFMVVNFMQKGVSFLTAPIFTRLLTPEEYGKITVFQSWIDVIGIFAMFGLYNNVFYNGLIEFKKDRNNFTFSMLMLSNIITVIVFQVVWNVNKYFFCFLNITDELIIFMFLIFLLEPAFEFWKIHQRFGFKYKLLSFFLILVMIFSPVCSILGIFMFPEYKVEARLIGSQLITLVICFGCYLLEILRSEHKPCLKYWKYALLYNAPLIPYFLSTYILSSSDRLMIAYYCGEDKAGIYGIAYTMSMLVMIIWNSVDTTMLPTIYKRCDEKRINTLSEFVIPVCMSYAVICIAIMLIAPEIIAVLAPSSYGEGMYVIPAVVGGVFFSCILGIFSNIIYYFKKPKLVMLVGVSAAIVNFVLNMIFIPLIGYLAAGYTTLCSYLLEAIGAYLLMKKIINDSVYDMKYILTYGVMVLGTAILSPLLYDYLLIRIILVSSLGAFLWINKWKIINVIWRK